MRLTDTFDKIINLEVPLPRSLQRVSLEPVLIALHALVTLACGYGLLMFPERTLDLLTLHAWDLPAARDAAVRLTGALLGGLAVTLLCLVPMTAPEVRRRIATGLFVTNMFLFFWMIAFLASPYSLLLIAILWGASVILARRLHVYDGWGSFAFSRGGLQQRWQEEIREAAAQQERNRLARDLHDSIKQQLFSIRVASATVEARWDSDPQGAREALTHVRKSAYEATAEMQALLHQLRPEALANAGLVEALREQCEALGYRTGAQVEIEIGELPADEQLPPTSPEALFRIAQEALANVARHARAGRVRVRLGVAGREAGRALELVVWDDGKGFDLPQAGSGMGLRNMRDRLQPFGGSLDIESTPSAGTRLRARLPLGSSADGDTREPADETLEQRSIRRVTANVLSMALLCCAISTAVWRQPEAYSAFSVALALFALFSGLWGTAKRLRFDTDSMVGGTILARIWPYCVVAWSTWIGWLSSLSDASRWAGLGIAVFALGVLCFESAAYYRRQWRTSEATAKQRHIWLAVLLLGFAASLPLMIFLDAPRTVASVSLIASSVLYVAWWLRENL